MRRIAADRARATSESVAPPCDRCRAPAGMVRSDGQHGRQPLAAQVAAQRPHDRERPGAGCRAAEGQPAGHVHRQSPVRPRQPAQALDQ